MTYKGYKSLRSFLGETKDRVYRFWVYRRMFTPYEQSQKFTDESVYEDTHAILGYIRESIPLPAGDVLLGIEEVYPGDDGCDGGDECASLQYYKLSELRISWYPSDMPDDGGEDNEQ